VLGPERAAALAERGLTTPADLRALAYARANRDGGFVAPERRAGCLADLIDGLDPAELERALWLDAPDQAVLVRDGPPPTAADVRSCYNVQVLETQLCIAPESHFALWGDRRLVGAVAARHAVQVSVDAATVTLNRPSRGYLGCLAIHSWSVVCHALAAPTVAMSASRASPPPLRMMARRCAPKIPTYPAMPTRITRRVRRRFAASRPPCGCL